MNPSVNPLPAPEFVVNDPAAIEAGLIAKYEADAGKTLYPAQIERLLINLLAYAQSQTYSAIQHAAEQMLVRTSRAPILDYLGDLVGTQRLLAQSARATFVFTLADPATTPSLIPVGTRILSQDGRISFTTDADVFIAIGALSGSVSATCETPGVIGNDWSIDSLKTLDTPLPFDVTVHNNSVPSGGADAEDDERYRTRIISAPEAYTNAGSYGAYRHHAMSAHQSIVDVAVLGPAEGEPPGQVTVVPLIDTGLPDATLLDYVASRVSADTVRPLCDTVVVRAPTAVPYVVDVVLTVYESADAARVLQQAQTALADYLAARAKMLGADLVPEQIAAACHVPGVYRAVINQPALQVLAVDQWGQCTGMSITVAGAVHG